MKRKLAITAIVVLAIGFFGLAGGFTKSETWWHDPCEQYPREAQEHHDCLSDIYYVEDNCDDPEELFVEENNCDVVLAWLSDESMSYQKVVFDPRSTVMFAMGGLIIGLLPLARKRVK